jgi:muramidase (phage lysozyme)
VDQRSVVAAALLGIGALVLYRRAQASPGPAAPVYAPATYYPTNVQPATYYPVQQQQAPSAFDAIFNVISNIFTPSTPSYENPNATIEIPSEQPYSSSNPFFENDIDWGNFDYGYDYYDPTIPETPPAPAATPPADSGLPDWITGWFETPYTAPAPYSPPPSQPTYVPQVSNNDTPITPNIAAFLRVIKYAEGTDPNGRGQDPYRIVYGYNHIVQNMSDHPSNTGEWPGAQTPWGWTTAAGAYQFLQSTWNDLNTRYGFRTFTPYNQDQRVIERLKDRGALTAVQNGDFENAIALTNKEWASLPGSPYGQPTRTMAQLAQVYADAGGTISGGVYAGTIPTVGIRG